jgi:predicted Zn-dependent peptidase
VEDYFGSIPKGPEIKRPKIEWQRDVARQTKDVSKDNTPLPASLHAWRAVPETHPDAYAIELLSSILSKGRSSRLYRRLVDEEQVAVAVEAFAFLQEKAGMVGVFATGNSGVTLDKLDALISEEVEKVRENGVTEEEFQKVRNQQEADFATAFGSMSSRAKNLARYHVFYEDTNLINTELERYLKVKREDLQRVAREYLVSDHAQILRYPVPAAPVAEKSPAPAAK